jgi:NAD(P)-dependent dehydrogenase (short-subunit alcohol dehydrogenase family)
MQSNPLDSDGARGSIILTASTSGYFGGTGVLSYIATKHGVVGAARASQRKAKELDIRVNVIAPFFTPTYITGRYSDEWKKRGLPANTVEDVANAVVSASTVPERQGHHVMVSSYVATRTARGLRSTGCWKIYQRDRNGEDSDDERVARRGYCGRHGQRRPILR